MKKKLALVFAVLITGFVLFGYNEFNGNFISKQIAKSTLKDHLDEQYHTLRYDLGKGKYNFKFSVYTFDVILSEGTNYATYTFEVGPKYIPTTIQAAMIHYDSMDEEKTYAWRDEGSAYVKALLADVPIGDVSYSVDVPKEFAHTAWSPNVPVPIAPTISIQFPLYKGETKEQFIEQIQAIQTALNADGIRYDSVFAYMDQKFDNRDGHKEGYAPIYYETKYRIQFEKDSSITTAAIQ